MMDYEKYIELDNVTVGDCIDAYEYRGLRVIVNDGKIMNFINGNKGD